MRAYVGITDLEWFRFLASRTQLDEVNFWQPSARTGFAALDPGELFLFKLHSPNDFIVGGGLFAHYTKLPMSLAWETFGEKNGVTSAGEMRRRVMRYRRGPFDPREDFTVGCILLEQPFFLDDSSWIRVPPDWAFNIVRGRRYDLTTGPGLSLWEALNAARMPPPLEIHEERDRHGKPLVVRPRLGQGTFRALVTDLYSRRCAVTGERTLPVLEAAHIRPFEQLGPHEPGNGLLLRSDLHTLLDRGYVTVSADYRFEVSRRIREEFENGRDYYALHGNRVALPPRREDRPSPAFLQWHAENVYRG